MSSKLLPLLLLAIMVVVTAGEETDPVLLARDGLARAKNWARASMNHTGASDYPGRAWADCIQLYGDSELQIGRLTAGYDAADASAWLSAALTSHTTCVDGLLERNETAAAAAADEQWKVVLLLRKALALHASVPAQYNPGTYNLRTEMNSIDTAVELLVSWDASYQDVHIVVAKDGSGNYKFINEAIAAVQQWRRGGSQRIVIYVKTGVYEETVEIDRNTINVMIVGDGMEKTVVSGRRNILDGYTIFSSATVGVAGDGFWARDITFENIAGPEKQQAVAFRVSSDRSVFYRCSFKGYQDTLFLLSGRQFFRDCDIYGTIDFIFGNAAAVLQNCNIVVRRPIWGQSNMITAQGRDDPYQSTGFSIHGSRVIPDRDFERVKGLYGSYLGRPWKKYSRTVIMKTNLDGLVHPDGWARWSGNFALDTLYYGEYMNTGPGADTARRVKWPGFHVLSGDYEASKFTVESFIQGDAWIPHAGVPYQAGL